jgi:hypothetical protein
MVGGMVYLLGCEWHIVCAMFLRLSYGFCDGIAAGMGRDNGWYDSIAVGTG